MRLHVTGAETVDSLLARRAREHPGCTFLVFEDPNGRLTERSYAAMHERAGRVASLLDSLGVRPGDAVHVHLPNRPEFYDLWFATARLGAVLVPTNPLLTAEELRFVLEHAACRVSVTQDDLSPAVTEAGAEQVVLTGDGPGPRLEEALATEELTPAKPPDPSTVAAVLYTSGTTSRPKGVLVTHANYLYVGEVVAQHLRIRPEDRMLVVLPLFHANAQYYSTMSALVSGASIALVASFSASRWGEQARRLEATLASLFAAPIRMILAQVPRPEDSDNRLRAVLFSQNVTAAQLEEFEKRFGAPLLQLYGMTETIAPPVLNPLYGERRNLGIGRPTLPSRIRIVNQHGEDAAVGEVGELLVAGEPGVNLMAGYLNDPEATSAALKDGWLHTGDAVRADGDGYLYFVDRRKDMIKRAGENVSAGEIEAVVNSHPEVFESAAIGVPDEVRDEAIKLYVVPGPNAALTEEAVLDWCRERLARFKVPSYVELVDILPRTSVGKIRKEVLRGRAVAAPGTEVRMGVEE